ncbi:MAG: DUF411 domain-containing protein [Leptolyngbyaceae cyanobacterium]
MNYRFLPIRAWVLTLLVTAILLVTGVGAPAAASGAAAIAGEMTVYRDPSCGCCGKWVKHMEAAGFTVRDEVTDAMMANTAQSGVPEELSSCHTAIANGYLIEGHVPADDVQRLLTTQPNVAGLTAPGMPMGSPGMESAAGVEPYTVFSFTDDGAIAAFANHD